MGARVEGVVDDCDFWHGLGLDLDLGLGRGGVQVLASMVPRPASKPCLKAPS